MERLEEVADWDAFSCSCETAGSMTGWISDEFFILSIFSSILLNNHLENIFLNFVRSISASLASLFSLVVRGGVVG
jgi:hypothetical protein